MTSEHDREISRLLAERDIRNLIARAGHLADDGDLEEYMQLWDADASWGVLGEEPHVGHDALRSRWIDHVASGTQGQGSNARHINTTLWVAFDDDDDHARSQSYYIYLRDASEQPPVVTSTGRYEDTFRCTAKGWRFSSRRINKTFNK